MPASSSVINIDQVRKNIAEGNMGLDVGRQHHTVSPRHSSGSSGLVLDPNDPDRTFASITNAESDRFFRDYLPAIKEQISRLDDTSIFDKARERAGMAEGRARGLQSRQLARYGQTPTALQAQELEHGLQTTVASERAHTLNTGRIAQVERNEGLRNSLIDMGRGFAASGMQGLSQAANAQASRENANKIAKEQHSAQQRQMAAQFGATAILFASML